MQDLITSYIIQSKECRLGDLGRFRRTTMHAETDITNKQIAPPLTEILFTGREEKISDGLIKYIGFKKKMSSAQALKEIKNWCSESKLKLKNGEDILLLPLGVLKKATSGSIFFHTEFKDIFFAPAKAERMIHKDSDHAMIVGDKETTSSVMNQFYNEEETEVKSNTWKIFAIILLVIALVMLFIYFYGYPVTVSSFGSHIKIIAPSSGPTYSIQ